MTEIQPAGKPGSYRTSTMTVLIIGAVCLALGALAYIALSGTLIGAIGFFVGLFGLALVVIGIVRVARRKVE